MIMNKSKLLKTTAAIMSVAVLTFSVGGDHDLSILNSACLDLSLITSNYRPDVIIPGYNKNTIPKNLDEETYKIFIHGLLSADGHHTNVAGGNTKNEFRGIQITGSSKLDDISQLLEMAGYYISSVNLSTKIRLAMRWAYFFESIQKMLT